MAEDLPPTVQPARVVLRTLTPRDLPLVTSSWIRSAFRAENKSREARIDERVYCYWHHRVLEAIIPRSKASIVACDETDPDRIYGYGIAERDASTLVVHHVYVRRAYRGQGIGSELVATWMERKPSALVWTHETRAWRDFMRHVNLDLPGVYNPYVMWLAWGREERR